MTSRPAETGGVASAVALLVAYFAGVHDSGVIVALATVVGFVPAAITWTVETMRKPSKPSTTETGSSGK